MSIIREIEVTRKGLARPIDVTYGTNMLQIEFVVTDFILPEGATSRAFAMDGNKNVKSQPCTVSGNKISFEPKVGLFEEGKNILQLAVNYNGKNLFTFYQPVTCHYTMQFEGAKELENDPTFAGMVMQMQQELAEISQQIDDLKNNGTGNSSGTFKMSNVLKAGEIVEKPDSFVYCGWALNNVQYDKDLNAVMFLYNATVGHGDHDSLTLYLGKLDLKTYDVTLTKIHDLESSGHKVYSCGFVINPNGDYLFLCADAPYLYKSTNKGETWSKINIPVTGFCLTRLDNGRYLYHDWSNYGVYYSDDEGANWTKTNATKFFEACFVDFKDGRVMAICRKTSYGTSNGAWNGVKQVEPAVIAKSEDWGATWTSITDSKSIIEMTADNCCSFYHEDEGLIELFVTSRMTHGDSNGAIFQYIASVEDAWNDNWGTAKVVGYSTCIDPQDFGYIGGCFDSEKNMHIMYYDGDSSESGSCNYKYIKASRNQSVLPVSKNVTSMFLPYSGITVDKLIKTAIAKLQSQIDKLIIQGGGIPEVDPDTGLDGSSLVYDGLYDYIDYTDTSIRDTDNILYNGYYGKITSTAGRNNADDNDMTYFNDEGGERSVLVKVLDSAGLPISDGITLEMEVDVVIASSTAGHNPFSIDGSYVFRNDAKIGITYYATEEATTTTTSYTSEGTCVLSKVGRKHLVATFDANSANYYLEGKCIRTFSSEDLESFYRLKSEAFTNAKANVWWGQNDIAYAKMLRVYNRALTADEVKNNYLYQSSQRS